MLQLDSTAVIAEPFPHVVAPQAFPADFFRALQADYPPREEFEAQRERTGMDGTRTGNGMDIYRGDVGYERLLARSAAWRELDAWINSEAFVRLFFDVFGPSLAGAGCRVTSDGWVYRRD